MPEPLEPVPLVDLPLLEVVGDDDIVYVEDVAGDRSCYTTAKRLATRTYTHDQSTPSTLWSITHNLGKRPSVTVVDTAGKVWIGVVQFVSDNVLTVSFNNAFSGKAYLN